MTLAAFLLTCVLGDAAATDNAKLEEDLTPDKRVRPGQYFMLSWRIKNTGTTTWPPGLKGYTLNLVTSPANVYGTLPSPVTSGSSVEISILMWASLTPGSHSYNFQMNKSIKPLEWFGPNIEKTITVAGTANNVIAAIDPELLDLIDKSITAEEFARLKWHSSITLDHFKAWLATIAWSEGGLGGYAAHSDAAPGRDRFDHVAVGEGFYFSTGIGPFQLDNINFPWPEGNTAKWPTIWKLDRERAVKAVVKWHKNKIPTNSTLQDIHSKVAAVWYGVADRIGTIWNQTTGTVWTDPPSELNWADVKRQLSENAADPAFRYDYNVKYLGKKWWYIKESIRKQEDGTEFYEDIKTDDGKQVSLNGEYDTWYIRSRRSNGSVAFGYYYTTNTDSIEVWLYDNYADAPENRHRYAFIRDCSKNKYPQYPEGHEAPGLILSRPAIQVGPWPVDLVFCIDSTGSMLDEIDNVKAKATAIVLLAASLLPDLRMAVVDYRDYPESPYGDPGDYTFKVRTPFTSNPSKVIDAIQSISVGGGGDWDEAVYSALAETIDGKALSGWRPGPTFRVILLMGDAPPHDPEPFPPYYKKADIKDLAKKGGVIYKGPFVPLAAQSRDATSTTGEEPASGPIAIYSIVVGDDTEAAAAFADLANSTGGEMFSAGGAEDVVGKILEVLNVIAGEGTNIVDVTSNVTTAHNAWTLDLSSGALVASITLSNSNGKGGMPLEKLFWYAITETTNVRLATVSGYTNGLAYYDVTAQIEAQLPSIGNGDLKLDVGESVSFTVPIYSRDRSIPEGHIYSIWADPPRMGVVLPPRISAIRNSDGDLVLTWSASQTQYVVEETDSIIQPNWKVLSVSPTLQGQHYTVTVPIRSGTKFYRLRKN
jgi:hypothetical protein